MNRQGGEYNLEERTYKFAKEVSLFCKILPKSISNDEYIRQVKKNLSEKFDIIRIKVGGY